MDLIASRDTDDVMNHYKVQRFLWYFQMKLEVSCLQFVCGPIHSVNQCMDPIIIKNKYVLYSDAILKKFWHYISNFTVVLPSFPVVSGLIYDTLVLVTYENCYYFHLFSKCINLSYALLLIKSD